VRPSLDDVMIAVAFCLAQRATCVKRQVGCVLVDKRGRILSAGYNGVAAGLPHCTDTPCVGAKSPAGSDTCQAVHAELNALMECRDVQQVHTCYVTTLPCNNCMKTLLNTSCQHIAYLEEHDHAAHVISEWSKAGRKTTKLRPK